MNFFKVSVCIVGVGILYQLPSNEFWGIVALYAFFGAILWDSDRKALGKSAYHQMSEEHS